jgi:hypothetical protein
MAQKVKFAQDAGRREEKKKGTNAHNESLQLRHCGSERISLLSRHENRVAAEHSNTLEQPAPLERIALCLDKPDFDKAVFGNRLEHYIAAESLLTTIDHADTNVSLFGLVVGGSGGRNGYIKGVQGGAYGAQ